jgi:hypothetical protein
VSRSLHLICMLALASGCGGDAGRLDTGTLKFDGRVHQEASSGKAYGDPCDPVNTSSCGNGLDCVGITGYKSGWCTKQCSKASAGKVCEGMPLQNGTAAWCSLADSTDTVYWCLFICAAGKVTFPCPSPATTCGPEDPVGSGQKKCMPVN